MTAFDYKFYTISDIAALFNVHKNTVRRWRDNGEIPKLISINSQSLFWPKEIFDGLLTKKQNEGRPQ